jgi:hypothetical protein
VTELHLARRDTKRKNQGEGRTVLPLKRKAIRQKIENTTKHKGDDMTTVNDLGPLGRAIVELDRKGLMPKFHLGGDGPMALSLVSTADQTEVVRLTDPLESGALLLSQVVAADARHIAAFNSLFSDPESETTPSVPSMGKLTTPSDYGTHYPTRRDEEADPEITVESIQASASEKGITFREALRESEVEPQRDLPWAGGKRPLPERTDAEKDALKEAAKRSGFGDIDDPNDGHSGNSRFV